MTKHSDNPLACIAMLFCSLMLSGCSGSPEQPPFTLAEFDTFLVDATLINNTMLGKSALFAVTQKPNAEKEMRTLAHEEIRKAGWDLDRFYYIYGRCVVYGTYETARRRAAQREANLAEQAPHDGDARAELKTARKSHAMALAILREKLDRDIPKSEQVFIHERADDVLHIVSKTAIHFFP